VELAETRVPHGEGAGSQVDAAEPSVSSALEHLAAGSQGAITKRIDLALLEGQELLSRTFRGAAMLGFGMVLAAGAWFAAATGLVLLATPEANPVVRLAIFALLNAAGAVGLVALAMRRRRKGGQP
jgi:uncharacterized membrane protein YqjE